jgi:hypothetical protein
MQQTGDAVNKADSGTESDPDPASSSDSDEEPSQKRAKRHSKTPYNTPKTDPTQLQFYPSQWRDILEEGKKKYRLSLLLETLFPDRNKDIHFAVDCLEEAISDHEAEGGMAEAGEYAWSSQYISDEFKSRLLSKICKRNGYRGALMDHLSTYMV